MHLGGAPLPEGADVLRVVEGLVGREAELLLGEAQLLLAEGLAVDLGGAGAVGGAESDDGAADDQGRAVGALRLAQGLVDRGRVEAVAVEDAPAVGLEARGGVVGEREADVALDRDLVGVVEDDELREAEAAGEGRGLVRDALLEVAVAAHHVDVVVEEGLLAGAVEARLHHRLGDRHADAVGEALAERAGGDLDADRAGALGVAGRDGAPLAELPEVVERDGEAGLVQERVEQGGAVAAGEDEAVAVVPLRVAAGDAEVVHPERGGGGGHAEGEAGVAGVGGLDLVGGEAAEDVGGAEDFGGIECVHGGVSESGIVAGVATGGYPTTVFPSRQPSGGGAFFILNSFSDWGNI